MSDRKHPLVEHEVRSAYLRLRGEHEVTFRVDPVGRGPAMVRGEHASLSHLERVLPAAVAPALPSLRRAIERACSWAEAAQRATEVLSVFEVDRRDEPRVIVRRHPAHGLRPDVHGVPVDHELLALEHGAREVIKRMWPPGQLGAQLTPLETRGLVTQRFGVTSHGGAVSERDVVFVARDAPALAAALRVEAALQSSRGRDDDAAVREMGALLGYPRCCVDRFVRMTSRDDASLAGALLGPLGVRMPFETAFTVVPFALVSHAPCAPGCAPTIALARALLAAMPDAARARYEGLASARWGIDAQGCVVHEQAGSAVRIDPSDPDLRAEPSCATSLHWVTETESPKLSH